MMNKGNIKFGLIGLGVGIAAGVTAGILLAPKSGKETRGLIKDQAGKATSEASSKFHDVAGKVTKSAKDKTPKSTKKE